LTKDAERPGNRSHAERGSECGGREDLIFESGYVIGRLS